MLNLTRNLGYVVRDLLRFSYNLPNILNFGVDSMDTFVVVIFSHSNLPCGVVAMVKWW